MGNQTPIESLINLAHGQNMKKLDRLSDLMSDVLVYVRDLSQRFERIENYVSPKVVTTKTPIDYPDDKDISDDMDDDSDLVAEQRLQ